MISIGDRVQERRKGLKMSQQALAKDICAQAMVSKIERNEISPSMNIMHQIAERLDVTLSYFYGEESTKDEKEERIDELKMQIRERLKRRDYEAISFLMEGNKEVVQTIVKEEDRTFFDWIQVILDYYIYENIQEAFAQLAAIQYSDISPSLAVEITQSVGTLYYEQKEYNKAIDYFARAEEALSKKVDIQVKAKLYLNYALSLSAKEEYKSALERIILGMDLLIENDSLYLLGDFYYQKGLIQEALDNLGAAYESFQLAASIYKIQKNELAETRTRMIMREWEG